MLFLCILAAIGLAVILAALLCYRMAFYVPDNRTAATVPDEEIYKNFSEQIAKWTAETAEMDYEQFKIKSFDGLDLYGKFYEFAPGAPVELMFHGYRGNAERDLAGGVQRCFSLGRSAFLVDQRCSGKSGGNVISFGIN